MPGLANLGNTCFVASIVQALAGSEDVIAAARSSLKNKPIRCLGRAACELLLKLADQDLRDGSVLTPTELIGLIREKHKAIGFAQQDAEEAFLIICQAIFSDIAKIPEEDAGLGIITQLSKPCELHKSIDIPLPLSDPLISNGVITAASRSPPACYEGIFVRHNIVSPMAIIRPQLPPLRGMLASSVHCADCGGHKEWRIDPFLDLSLAIPFERQREKAGIFSSVLKIEDCLRHLTQDELVHGALCDRCVSKTSLDAWPSVPSSHAPHLRRFTYIRPNVNIFAHVPTSTQTYIRARTYTHTDVCMRARIHTDMSTHTGVRVSDDL